MREVAAINESAFMNRDNVIDAAIKLIKAFCEERHFSIPYTRVWNSDGATVFDVGSHTECFHLVPEIDFTRHNIMKE